MSELSMPVRNEKVEIKELYEPKSLIYLPKEGLQGEDIPSHMLWEGIKVESVQILFRPPLVFKEIFNAESWKEHNNEITVNKVELDGYVGLSFKTKRVSALEVVIPVKYLIYLSGGKVIEETRDIKLFRPQLELEVSTKVISVDPKTRFIKGRIKIKNAGRGTLMMHISTTEDSLAKLETPPEHREFAEKFLIDLYKELSDLAEEFPQFKTILEESQEWDKKNLLELSTEERKKFEEYITKVANTLASDKNLLQGFVNAYGKALAKNSELIEAVRRLVRLYESLVSKDLLLINPFDEVTIGKKTEIALTISQTDKVYGLYDDIILPKIELTSSEDIKVPIYRLFDWGK